MMPRVRFEPVSLDVEVSIGRSVLEAARELGVPQGSRCRGVMACSKCHVYVESGLDLLTEQAEREIELLALSATAPRSNSRLGCQARLVAEGDLVVRISEESFDAYLEEHPEERDTALALWLG